MRECDVAIIGGAFSGAATALLLKRARPATRILLIEKAAAFDRKVGESTTEVSSCFLTRTLCLSTYLAHEQLPKQGLRMWFNQTADQPFDECVEIGARNNARLPGFQVDRAKLDEQVLAEAAALGCEVLRPAKVTAVELAAERNRLTVSTPAGSEEIGAKWVIDASGRAAWLSRKLGLFRQNTEHPISAIWGRFRGVKDWDGHAVRPATPGYGAACRTARGLATNHLTGRGWWCWIIPLKGGDTSVGLVYDERLFAPAAAASLEAKLRAHWMAHPIGREILGDAELCDRDIRAFSSLPYWSEQIIGDRWALVGDAASFIDPLYSPGLDFCAFTAQGVASLVERALDGEEIEAASVKYNADFRFCYRAWFEAVYRGKYHYLGDAELMRIAFLLDISLYHLGPVRQVQADPERAFGQFPFEGIPGRIVAGFMRFYNGRLATLAEQKFAAGTYGDRNAHWRMLLAGFLPEPASAGRLAFRGLRYWLRAELRALFLPRVRTRQPNLASPQPAPRPFDADGSPSRPNRQRARPTS